MQNIIKLIKELTPREKAYFRKFTKIHHAQKEKNYLKLYEAIIKNEAIDIDSLRKKFKGTKIYNHFSSEMHYLFEQLMKALLNYNLNNNDSSRILKNISYIEILLAKGNKTRAAKLLKNAKQLAYEKEDFPLIIKLIQLEEQILFKQGILNFIQNLETLRKERQEVNQKIENINELRVLKEMIRDFQYSHLFIDDPQQFPNIFNHRLLSDESKALSLTALDSWHYAHVAKAYVTRSYEGGVKAGEAYFRFLKNNQYFFSEDKLLPVISNYLLSFSLIGDKNRFYKLLEVLDQLENNPLLDKAYIDYIRIGRLLELSYRTQDLSLEMQILENAEVFLEKQLHELAASHKEFLFFRVTRACINLQAYKKAQDMITFWQQEGGQVFMISIRRLLKLIIIYELGWTRTLIAEIAASYKSLRRHKQYNALEKVMIRFFRKSLKNNFDEPKQLKLLEQQLESIKKNSNDNKYFEYFDYHRWCQKKVLQSGVSQFRKQIPHYYTYTDGDVE